MQIEKLDRLLNHRLAVNLYLHFTFFKFSSDRKYKINSEFNEELQNY